MKKGPGGYQTEHEPTVYLLLLQVRYMRIRKSMSSGLREVTLPQSVLVRLYLE